jgi:hypothetical protein
VSDREVAIVLTSIADPGRNVDGTSLTDVLAIVLLVVLLVAPIVATAYLAQRMRKHPEATA